MASPPEQATPFWRRTQELGVERSAEMLTAALGKPVDRIDVQRFGRRRNPPRAWREALGADTPSPAAPDDDTPPDEPAARQTEQAPKAPSDAKVLPPAPELRDVARKRIAEIHVFAGGAIATAADPDGFQHDRGPGGGIAKVWTDKAPDLAQAWVAWADEGNKFAQSVVRLMSTGGAGGELVMGYVMLLGGTAYMLGQIPDNDATRFLYGRYSKYRPVDVPAPVPVDDDVPAAGDPGAAAGAAGGNGQVDGGSVDRMAAAGVPPGV